MEPSGSISEPLDDRVVQFWNESRTKLRWRIVRLVGSDTDADDLLQDVFVRSYPQAFNLAPEKVPRYLWRTANSVARDYLRKQRRTKEKLRASDVLDAMSADTPTPYDLYVRTEEEDVYRSRIMPAVAALPPPQRGAIQYFQSGQRLATVSRETGIPVSTIRSRQQSAVEALRRNLDL